MRAASFVPLGLLCLASQAFAARSKTASTSTSSMPSSTSTSSSSAASQTATSGVIPTDISQSCSDFLTTLNTDANIQACTAPLLQATTYYTNATASATAKVTSGDNGSAGISAQTLSDSLGKLCDGTTGCQPGIVRAQLSKFWTACSTELRAKNQAVLDVYDVMYLLNPFHDAVCTQDSSKNYCLLTIANSSAASAATSATTSKRSLLTEDESLLSGTEPAQYRKRQASTSNAETALTTTSNSNIAFLFLQPNSTKQVLCSDCSKNILAAYIRFETSIPYAIGLANSANLAGQSALYKAMQNTCGAGTTKNVNELAGTTAFATVASGAMSSLRLAPASAGMAVGIALLLVGALAL